MANLELEGKIVRKLAVQSGQSARGQWAKQEFVLEYMDGSFPTSVCFTAWGDDKVNDLNRFQVGDSVKVAFNIRGREYNGKWYNDLRVWRLSSPIAPGAEAPSKSAAPQAPVPEAPAPTIDDMPFSGEDSEDLPF
jgi:hypothetical protein